MLHTPAANLGPGTILAKKAWKKVKLKGYPGPHRRLIHPCLYHLSYPVSCDGPVGFSREMMQAPPPSKVQAHNSTGWRLHLPHLPHGQNIMDDNKNSLKASFLTGLSSLTELTDSIKHVSNSLNLCLFVVQENTHFS